MPARSTATQAPPTVLLTGFDAFGGASLNPSWLAVQALHGRRVLGHKVVAAQLPTVFDQSLNALNALLKAHSPALVICMGQAGGRRAVSLERVAINVNDAPIADNAGAIPVDTPVKQGAPVAYFTTLPIKAMLATLQQAGLPAEVSQTAGTFVCNHVFYGLMHALATRPALRHTRGGFVHVPWLPEQGSPSMPLDDMVQALRLAVRCALQVRQDGSVGSARGGGATH
ncbi:pyroglutamyl-peptidase I [Hydrogenophaga sp. XSHU_21]